MPADADTLALIPPPPPALLSNNPGRWFRFFGPGAIIASCTIGSGEVLFSTRGGAVFGYRILWVFLLASAMKWLLCYSSMRHMILSGAHPFQRWNHIPGPRGWFPMFMFGIGLVSFPIWASFLAGVLGTACKWVFGVQEIFEGHDTYCWASIALVLAMLIMLIGTYQILEYAQVALILVMMVCMAVSVAKLGPDWSQVLSGALIPRIPEYPDWVLGMKEFKGRTPLLEIMVYVSAIGGASFDYIAYLSFLREKKWGAVDAGVLSPTALDEVAAHANHNARLWVRAALIDTVASFAVVAILSSAFALLGTIVLAPEHTVPQGEELLNHQARFLERVAPWMVGIYKAAIFSAFLSILYGGPEMNFRVVAEYLNSTVRYRQRFPERRLRIFFVLWCLVGGLVLVWVGWYVKEYQNPEFSLVKLISPIGVYTGVLTCGFFCLLNPWMDWKFLPRSLRMGPWMAGLNLMAGTIFTLMALRASWDDWWYTEQKWHAYFLLAALIAAAMGLSYLLRHFLHGEMPRASGASEGRREQL